MTNTEKHKNKVYKKEHLSEKQKNLMKIMQRQLRIS